MHLFCNIFFLLSLLSSGVKLFELDNAFLQQEFYMDINLAQERIVINKNTSIFFKLQNVLKSGQKVKAVDINGLYLYNKSSLIEIFFPLEEFDEREKLEAAIDSGRVDVESFSLKCLNLTSNELNESFLETRQPVYFSNLFNRIVHEFFAHLRLLQLSSNKLRYLERKHFELLPHLEALILNANQLSSIRHDTFYDLTSLRFLDLSHNRLKIIHPLTFSYSSNLYFLNLRSNSLLAIFDTPSLSNSSYNSTNLIFQQKDNFTLNNLKYLYLSENKELSCDCGLLWLNHRVQKDYKLVIDEFKCVYNKTAELIFEQIKNENLLKSVCRMPNLAVNTEFFDRTSSISSVRSFSKRWFAWNLLVDVLPVTTPFPYLSTNDISEEELNTQTFSNGEKHVFHNWYMNDAIFDCTSKNEYEEDNSNAAILWKTQYGYLSNMDDSLIGYDDENPINSSSSYNSFKIFYKMNKLTKISKNLTVKIGLKLGGQSHSVFSVNEKNQLIVTNMRQSVAGPFVCISLNERGVRMYEYDMHIRAAVSEYFIYCLFVSIVCSIIPSVIGLVVCCWCEYQADKNYPQTPPCYPTPLASTPPNFDFNEWMANAASYLPNLNIHDTLEQVSKKLRKGMEKASVTVKSLGLTSTAYIYSMYEQSTQRWSDIKSYVPTLNVPTITLPTMKYPPVGQLANRMRMGMGNMFTQLREFCGTSDLAHTASIVDLEADTNASNAVGKTYIIDQIEMNQKHQNQNQLNNYLRFLKFLKEHAKNNGNNKSNQLNKINDCLYEEYEKENEENNNSETRPTTSSSSNSTPPFSVQAVKASTSAGLTGSMSASTSAATQHLFQLNLLAKFAQQTNNVKFDENDCNDDENSDISDEIEDIDCENRSSSNTNSLNRREDEENEIDSKLYKNINNQSFIKQQPSPQSSHSNKSDL